MTDTMKLARSRGLVPDWAWYQINGKSAQENWVEQRAYLAERIEIIQQGAQRAERPAGA